MKKKLAMAVIVASLMALSALATFLVAGGAAATDRSSRIETTPCGVACVPVGTIGQIPCGVIKKLPCVPSGTIIKIRRPGFAHIAGTDLYCLDEYDNSYPKPRLSFGCAVVPPSSGHPCCAYPAPNDYSFSISDNRVEVLKMDSTGTSPSQIAIYPNK